MKEIILFLALGLPVRIDGPHIRVVLSPSCLMSDSSLLPYTLAVEITAQFGKSWGQVNLAGRG